MPLISFDQYRESSPATRNKWAAALGLQPMYSADVFGHSTPIAFVADKLKEKLKVKPNKPTKKKQHQVEESHDARPDYSFDRFIDKATKMRGEVDKEVQKGKDDEDKLDKDIKKKKSEKPDEDKSGKPFPPNKSGNNFKKADVSAWEKLMDDDDKDDQKKKDDDNGKDESY